MSDFIQATNKHLWKSDRTTLRPPLMNVSMTPILFRTLDTMAGPVSNNTFMCDAEHLPRCNNVCDSSNVNRRCVRCSTNYSGGEVYTNMSLDDSMNFKCYQERIAIHPSFVLSNDKPRKCIQSAEPKCSDGWKDLGVYGVATNVNAQIPENRLDFKPVCTLPVDIGLYTTTDGKDEQYGPYQDKVIVPFNLCRGSEVQEIHDPITDGKHLFLGEPKAWNRVGVFRAFNPPSDEERASAKCKSYKTEQKDWSQCAPTGMQYNHKEAYNCFKCDTCGYVSPDMTNYQCSGDNNPLKLAWPIDFYSLNTGDNFGGKEYSAFSTRKNDNKPRLVPGNNMIFARRDSMRDGITVNKYFGEDEYAKDSNCGTDKMCFEAGAYPNLITRNVPNPE